MIERRRGADRLDGISNRERILVRRARHEAEGDTAPPFGNSSRIAHCHSFSMLIKFSRFPYWNLGNLCWDVGL
jgi:hypothetical protein